QIWNYRRGTCSEIYKRHNCLSQSTDNNIRQSNTTAAVRKLRQSQSNMKGFIAAVCLSLLIAVVNCQTESSVVATCTQVCTQVCDIWTQIMSFWSGFIEPLAPYVETAGGYCVQGCGLGCGLLG
ncbi:hypothetical protein EGW08_010022, partial [Elysia chlorotica]